MYEQSGVWLYNFQNKHDTMVKVLYKTTMNKSPQTVFYLGTS